MARYRVRRAVVAAAHLWLQHMDSLGPYARLCSASAARRRVRYTVVSRCVVRLRRTRSAAARLCSPPVVHPSGCAAARLQPPAVRAVESCVAYKALRRAAPRHAVRCRTCRTSVGAVQPIVCATRAFSRPPRTASTPELLPSHEAATRSALGAAALRLQRVPGHRCTQQRQAQRTSAAGAACGASRMHDAARRRGAQVARRRSATHAQP